MERRLIQVENLPDQAGITAALRRAFEQPHISACVNDDDPFAELLKRLH